MSMIKRATGRISQTATEIDSDMHLVEPVDQEDAKDQYEAPGLTQRQIKKRKNKCKIF